MNTVEPQITRSRLQDLYNVHLLCQTVTLTSIIWFPTTEGTTYTTRIYNPKDPSQQLAKSTSCSITTPQYNLLHQQNRNHFVDLYRYVKWLKVAKWDQGHAVFKVHQSEKWVVKFLQNGTSFFPALQSGAKSGAKWPSLWSSLNHFAHFKWLHGFEKFHGFYYWWPSYILQYDMPKWLLILQSRLVSDYEENTDMWTC